MNDTNHLVNHHPYLATREGYTGTTSDRFAGISTLDALQPLTSAGFTVASLEAKRYRTEDRAPFIRHSLRLDHPEFKNRGGEYKPQIILRNANDGTAAFTLLAGLYRFACANGVVVGASAAAMRIRHVGDKGELATRILAASETIRETLPKLDASVQAWQARKLESGEVTGFFQLAAVARWGKAEALRRSDLTESARHVVRRHEDAGSSLWQVFNRAQETFTAGTVGWAQRRIGGRMASVRRLRDIDASSRLNRTLWDIAESANKGLLGDLHAACYQQDADLGETARTLALSA